MKSEQSCVQSRRIHPRPEAQIRRDLETLQAEDDMR